MNGFVILATFTKKAPIQCGQSFIKLLKFVQNS